MNDGRGKDYVIFWIGQVSLDLFYGKLVIEKDVELMIGFESSRSPEDNFTVLAVKPLTKSSFSSRELYDFGSFFPQACLMVTSNEPNEDNLICLS
jgi:hypothetical protein